MTGVPLNIDWQQILLHLLNFTILFGALYILLYKPVKDFMAKREAHYQEVEDNAMDNLIKTNQDKKYYEEKISAFDAEVRQEKDKARAEIEKINNQRLQEAQAEAERIVEEAKKSALREKEKIIASAQQEISDLVTSATEKLALEQSTSDAFDQFLDAAMGGKDNE